MAYTPKEKYSLIARYKQGATVAQISKESGVARATLYRWIRILTQSYPAKSRTHPEISISWIAD